MRAAFLGPEGTYSHEALRADTRAAGWEPVAVASIPVAVSAVAAGDVGRALVPMENSTEGAVGPTLDALAIDTQGVTIVGEVVHPVSHALIGAAGDVDLAAVRAVVSHPQVLAQCARFVRGALPAASVVAVTSSAEAVRMVATGAVAETPAVALGTVLATELFGGVVLRAGVQDEASNATRFVWVAREGAAPMGTPTKTSVVWWGAGDETAGWLVRCLSEFAFRGVNLTRIESRPRRMGLGHYMFFVDIEGGAAGAVADAIAALRGHAETVNVLGSYPGA